MTRFAFSEPRLTRRYLAAVIFASIAVSTSIGFAAEKINIYSYRQQVSIQPFLDAFTAKTGIDINVAYSSKGLAQRLKAEGLASPADVIFQGLCDVAIMNSYYYGNMRFGDNADQKEWAQAIRLVFTNQSDRGNHKNISGGGVAKYAKNKAVAIAVLKFLNEEKAQHLYGEINFEYPVIPAVLVNGELAIWDRFKPDSLLIERLAALAPKAQMIIDRVGW